MDLKQITKPVVTIGEEASFVDALNLMVEDKTNSLIVIDDEGVIVGEVCVTDLLSATVPAYIEGDGIAAHFTTEEIFNSTVQEAADKKVSDFMDKDFHAIHEDASMMQVAVAAIEQDKSRIPVIDSEDKPIGIVSRRGIKHILAKQFDIKDSD